MRNITAMHIVSYNCIHIAIAVIEISRWSTLSVYECMALQNVHSRNHFFVCFKQWERQFWGFMDSSRPILKVKNYHGLRLKVNCSALAAASGRTWASTSKNSGSIGCSSASVDSKLPHKEDWLGVVSSSVWPRQAIFRCYSMLFKSTFPGAGRDALTDLKAWEQAQHSITLQSSRC